MDKNDLIVLVAIALQAEINPSDDYFKQAYNKYLGYFKSAILKNG